MDRRFYGWTVALVAFFTFGLAVGIPYYGGPFFYDYYEKAFGWKRPDTTLGFPLGVTLTLWVGPLLVHRFSPRKLLMVGAGFTALAFLGFSQMTGALWMYYACWFLYVVGYIFSGPIVHQVIVSNWFRRQRGRAMAIVYLGVGVFGGVSAKYIARPLTNLFGFQGALLAVAGLTLLIWPLAYFWLRDKPSELSQFPDGDTSPHENLSEPPKSFSFLLSKPAFWLLTLGSFCSIGSIGSINQHMKFVFKEQGFTSQATLDDFFGTANLCVLFSSIAGRLVMGYLADKYNKKLVMMATYFLVALTIPMIFLVRPEQPEYMYVFAILFGFGMGADYMLIPLMAAEQFGVTSLARAMSIILPADTIGQAWAPYGIAWLHDALGGYPLALRAVFALSFVGAVAISLLPRARQETSAPQPEPAAANAR
jgi:MFS family permease